MLFHYESATRSQTKQVMHPEDTTRMLERHAEILREGDPFYNPNLSSVTQDHVLSEDAGCKQFKARVVVVNPRAPVVPTIEAVAAPAPKVRGKRKPAMAEGS